jgi:hypothetical protein
MISHKPSQYLYLKASYVTEPLFPGFGIVKFKNLEMVESVTRETIYQYKEGYGGDGSLPYSWFVENKNTWTYITYKEYMKIRKSFNITKPIIKAGYPIT